MNFVTQVNKKISGCERREIECGLFGDYWWWIISSILVFVLFAIFGVRRELTAAIAAKEGVEIDPKSTFALSAHKWLVRNWFVTTILILSVALFTGVQIFGTAFQLGVINDYQPSQPIAYSHKLHAGQMGIECKYCHHLSLIHI